MTEIIQADADQIAITECGCSCHKLAPAQSVHCQCAPRSAVIVMDGEPCPGSRTSCPPFTRAMCRYGGNPHPPKAIVALAGPCLGCGGAGVRTDIHGIEDACSAAGCRGGKPTFTLHQRCDHGGVLVSGGYEDRNGIGRPCACDGSGVIDLGDGWVIREAVEIRGPDDDRDEASYSGPAHIEMNPDSGYARYWPAWDGSLEWDDGHDITLPLAAVPGQYAILAEQKGTP